MKVATALLLLFGWDPAGWDPAGIPLVGIPLIRIPLVGMQLNQGDLQIPLLHVPEWRSP